ncbi:hypothetical protein F0U44_01035 [Nocardioides humilatus]|uniref:WD40 repeat domain-containing protein n=1 Tax=Nocardioides humilatus TaxID=2607660 RepID=A0A5B1LLE9_9ACTN|nr:hypothetical protein [Nocardioides humilatus]KAA1420958.1 hypothetical protein F0U44_01035 [Nocardioides humilatus]
MTGSELRDALDVVVREEAAAIHVDASAAWQQGRRRRLRRRVAVAAAAVAAIGIVATSVAVITDPPRPLDPASTDPVASSHPLRLDYLYWDDDLPSRTGPLAGLVERSGPDIYGWYAASPEGHLWLVDTDVDVLPSLSPDGSHLAYMRGGYKDAEWVVSDQVDGTEVTFPEIGTGVDSDLDRRYFQAAQSPSYWSPDGSAVLVNIGAMDPDEDPEPTAAVLGVDGSFSAITTPDTAGSSSFPLGWIDDRHIAVIGQSDTTNDLRVYVVDIRTTFPVREVRLLSKVDYSRVSQWFGTISTDGEVLATVSDRRIRYYSLQGPRQGRLRGSMTTPATFAGSCPLTWTGTDLYVPTATDRDTGASAILTRANGGTPILADPRLDISCSFWARTALEGPEHRGIGGRLFGTSESWLSWHWREVTISNVLGALLLTCGLVLTIRRRRR